eukprot:CAMPEP_0170511358 /NCGR_PEP_ID=MMETSP0208-20121228/66262_1 /TAXON_ID=197538 /ORGANISM="Strombidium inclinatum, Strain S3" /LENGTH=205 /DNA_ID=CAMNT_0010794893 /DNA_START=1162 /DNA_END=1779 /DNA_ORIENTATION=+
MEVTEVNGQAKPILTNEVILDVAVLSQVLLFLALLVEHEHILVVVYVRVDQPVLHCGLVSRGELLGQVLTLLCYVRQRARNFGEALLAKKLHEVLSVLADSLFTVSVSHLAQELLRLLELDSLNLARGRLFRLRHHDGRPNELMRSTIRFSHLRGRSSPHRLFREGMRQELLDILLLLHLKGVHSINDLRLLLEVGSLVYYDFVG